MTLPAPPHWVRHNDTSKHPACWVVFDTESQVITDDRGPVQVWRCAVAVHQHRRDGVESWRDPQWEDFTTPADLWDWITGRVLAGRRLVLVAHNLAFDLRIADAFTELAARGWTLDRVRLDGDTTSVRWRNGARTILAVDSMSWFPVALETIGAELGVRKVALPRNDAPLDVWLHRCRRDVEILSDAWLRLIRWLRAEDLGTWQPSGAGQSWTVWRHKFLTHRVLVDDDEPTRELERVAAWTGRCEAWRHGKLTEGPYHEWDYQLSYMRIAQQCELPTRVVGRVDHPTWKQVEAWQSTSHVLATISATVTEPVAPVRGAHGMLWPVGDIQTTVWGPELDLVRGASSQCTVHSVIVYSRAPILRAFADWVIPLALDESGDTDPVIRRVAKHWCRALIGRFGVRYRVWEPFGAALDGGITLAHAVEVDTGERYRVLSVAGNAMRESGVLEGENAVPAVMGFVMSEARARLWRAMLTAGCEHVVYVDTDGLVVDAVGNRRLEVAELDGLRHKDAYQSVEVWGPRQCVFGPNVRISGVPRRARRVGPRSWEGEVWPALGTSIEAGEAAGVRTAVRRMALRGVDHRRRHLLHGVTEPLQAPQ